MSIASEITRIQAAKADIKASIEAKGVTVPSDTLIDQYADYVDQIQTGGGQAEEDLKNLIERDITSITIPSGTTIIGNHIFVGCTELTSVTIPNSVTIIGQNTFQNCSGLTSITIPNSVTAISMDAFNGCRGLTSITIPNGVTSMAVRVFNGCSGLTSITIGNSITRINTNAFSGCSSLTSVTINTTTPPSLVENAFTNTNNCPIYVPSESVDAYKAATNWSSYADRIQAISE